MKSAGVSKVLVFCVNDGAVMQGWSKDLGIPQDSIIQLVADTRCELTKALDMVLDHPGPMSVLGTTRCKRFSMLVDDGIVRTVNIAAAEDDPAGDSRPEIAMVEKMLQDLSN